MEIGDFAFRLLLILFPGIIATLIYKRLILKKKWESIDFGINILLFGISSNLLLQLIYLIFRAGELSIWKRLQDNAPIPYLEIMLSSITALIIAGIATYANNKKTINNISYRLQISNKYGEDSLFYYFLEHKEITEVHILEPTLNLIYDGHVKYYSEDDQVKEIVLENVDSYNYQTSEKIDSFKYVYLSKARNENLIIEIPK